MVYATQDIEEQSQRMPVTQAARRTAEQFALQHPSPEKAERVRLNTLAVWVVNDYLQLMDIPTELSAGDSWNPVMRLSDDVADLVVTGLGRLECRFILPGEQSCTIPPEVWFDRIGYMVVRIEESFREATLLGFMPPSEEPLEQVEVAQLRSLDEFLDYIGRLEDGVAFLEGDDPVAVQVRCLLEMRSRSEIVAQLERIYRTREEYEWRSAGGEVLAGSDAGGGFDREEIDDGDGELEDLAESLLEKLAEIWGESV